MAVVRLHHTLLFGAASLFLAVCLASTALAQQAASCDTLLTDAHTAYVDQQYMQAIQRVDDCLRSGEPTPDELVTSHRLLALAYIRLDQLPDARIAILNLLNVRPDYTPDPVSDPPDYTVLVDVVRRQFQAQAAETPREQSWIRTHARWIASGAAAVTGVVLAAILLGGGNGGGGGGGGSSLPPPPSVPN